MSSSGTACCMPQISKQAVIPAAGKVQLPIPSTAPAPRRVAKEEPHRERDQVPPSPSPHSSSLKSSSTATTMTASSPPPKPMWRRRLSAVKWFLIDQWFLVAFGCLVLVASQVQVPASQQGKRETVVTYLCVAVIFFITGCTLPTRVLMENYGRWKIHLFVQTQSFLMTSAVVYGVVSLCATNRYFMDPGLLVGMVFTGCVPTTISSNIVMTRQAHGNTALTVVQSTLGNLLGPFICPLLLQMYIAGNGWYTDILPKSDEGEYGEIYRRVFKQLGLSLMLPLVQSILNPVRRTEGADIHAGSWSSRTKCPSPTDEKGVYRMETEQDWVIGPFDNHLANF